MLAAAPLLRAQTPKPPLNFVFILIDDMGWRDVSYNGSELFETPNIDRLASQGTRFTNAYASRQELALEEVTTAEALKPAGYKRGIVHEFSNSRCSRAKIRSSAANKRECAGIKP